MSNWELIGHLNCGVTIRIVSFRPVKLIRFPNRRRTCWTCLQGIYIGLCVIRSDYSHYTKCDLYGTALTSTPVMTGLTTISSYNRIHNDFQLSPCIQYR